MVSTTGISDVVRRLKERFRMPAVSRETVILTERPLPMRMAPLRAREARAKDVL